LNQRKFRDLEAIFHPRSIAVVGASNNVKDGTIFLTNLLNGNFGGKLYPVNTGENEILGLKSYPNVSAIPDSVDYVIVAVPARSVPDVLDDCAAAGVKAVQVYTAGFRESGTDEGYRLEEEIAEKARKGVFRIIGPNCTGIYNPSINLVPWWLTAKNGAVSLISQSGGVGYRVTDTVQSRGVGISKAVSFGNGCDLDSTDYLEYFAADPDTEIIGIYIEGVRDGRRLFKLLSQIGRVKPVVMWKGGKTKAGAEVTASHTGALAASGHNWEALSRQTAIVKVDSIDELADTLIAYEFLRDFYGSNAGIVCGLSRGGGGDSVSATDDCASQGLEVPSFSAKTREKLSAILPWAGTILRNALDVSMLGGVEVLEKALAVIADDPCVDLIIIYERINELLSAMPEDMVQGITRASIELKEKQPKPVVIVSPPGLSITPEQLKLEQKLAAARIPVYPSMRRAARAISNVSQYYCLHRSR